MSTKFVEFVDISDIIDVMNQVKVIGGNDPLADHVMAILEAAVLQRESQPVKNAYRALASYVGRDIQ